MVSIDICCDGRGEECQGKGNGEKEREGGLATGGVVLHDGQDLLWVIFELRLYGQPKSK